MVIESIGISPLAETSVAERKSLHPDVWKVVIDFVCTAKDLAKLRTISKDLRSAVRQSSPLIQAIEDKSDIFKWLSRYAPKIPGIFALSNNQLEYKHLKEFVRGKCDTTVLISKCFRVQDSEWDIIESCSRIALCDIRFPQSLNWPLPSMSALTTIILTNSTFVGDSTLHHLWRNVGAYSSNKLRFIGLGGCSGLEGSLATFLNEHALDLSPPQATTSTAELAVETTFLSAQCKDLLRQLLCGNGYENSLADSSLSGVVSEVSLLDGNESSSPSLFPHDETERKKQRSGSRRSVQFIDLTEDPITRIESCLTTAGLDFLMRSALVICSDEKSRTPLHLLCMGQQGFFGDSDRRRCHDNSIPAIEIQYQEAAEARSEIDGASRAINTPYPTDGATSPPMAEGNAPAYPTEVKAPAYPTDGYAGVIARVTAYEEPDIDAEAALSRAYWLLHTMGARVDLKDSRGCNAMLRVCEWKHPVAAQIAEMMRSLTANSNLFTPAAVTLFQRNHSGETPLYAAGIRGNSHTLRAILHSPHFPRGENELEKCRLAVGGSLVSRKMEEVERLRRAMSRGGGNFSGSGSFQGASLLLDCLSCDDRGFSPLHAAVINRSTDCVKILLTAGFSPNFPNCYHETPLHLAYRSENEVLIDMIKSAAGGNDPNAAGDGAGYGGSMKNDNQNRHCRSSRGGTGTIGAGGVGGLSKKHRDAASASSSAAGGGVDTKKEITNKMKPKEPKAAGGGVDTKKEITNKMKPKEPKAAGVGKESLSGDGSTISGGGGGGGGGSSTAKVTTEYNADDEETKTNNSNPIQGEPGSSSGNNNNYNYKNRRSRRRGRNNQFKSSKSVVGSDHCW